MTQPMLAEMFSLEDVSTHSMHPFLGNTEARSGKVRFSSTRTDELPKIGSVEIDYKEWIELGRPVDITVVVHAHPAEKTKIEVENA